MRFASIVSADNDGGTGSDAMTLETDVQKFFSEKSCRRCNRAFLPGAVEMLKREKEHAVARVVCTYCDTPLGTAFIGIDRSVYKESR
jgi:hypothetical protein